jgi:hypothetical protein
LHYDVKSDQEYNTLFQIKFNFQSKHFEFQWDVNKDSIISCARLKNAKRIHAAVRSLLFVSQNECMPLYTTVSGKDVIINVELKRSIYKQSILPSFNRFRYYCLLSISKAPMFYFPYLSNAPENYGGFFIT